MVAIIVPTRNSARTLAPCLASIRRQTIPITTVVVDNRSTDATLEIARALADLVLEGGPERSAQRNAGAMAVTCPVLGFIDSDMVLEPRVAEEASAAIDAGAAGVVVPERTVGVGFWARVRAFERSFYAIGAGTMVEAARFFPADGFRAEGGFDLSLTGPEDWDLSIRMGRRGRLSRTRSWIEHDESGATFGSLVRKRAYYARGYRGFLAKHGRDGVQRAMDRPYLRRPWQLLWPHPLLGGGLLLLKSAEAAVVFAAALRARR